MHEMILAYLLQYRYSKLAILRSYLSIAYFGTNLKGVYTAAANREIDIETDKVPEAAIIACQLVYPRPRVDTERWKNRISNRVDYISRVYVRNEQKFDKLFCLK